MGLNRILRRWIVGAMLAAVLFAQLATSAYACPTPGKATGEGQGAMVGMPCVEMMAGSLPVDDTQPGLCFEHCQADTAQPPVDSTQLANLPAATPAGFFILPMPLAPVGADCRWSAHENRRERAPPDAHCVVHCCWRI